MNCPDTANGGSLSALIFSVFKHDSVVCYIVEIKSLISNEIWYNIGILYITNLQ